MIGDDELKDARITYCFGAMLLDCGEGNTKRNQNFKTKMKAKSQFFASDMRTSLVKKLMHQTRLATSRIWIKPKAKTSKDKLPESIFQVFESD